MERMIITHSPALQGEVSISGAKNSALPILAASLLGTEDIILSDVPPLEDVRIILQVIQSLGAQVSYEDETTVRINSKDLNHYNTPGELMGKMRASFLVMGPLLARIGKSITKLPGGCTIGSRPVDYHLKGFKALGCAITQDDSTIAAAAPVTGLSGNVVYLDFPSVGATQNIMMAATLAKGTSIIENAAREPEIVDLANFLNKIGADIKGAGTSNIKIRGVERLKGGNHSIIPDRIEAATFMIGSAITGGNVLIKNIIPSHLIPVTAKLQEVGCTIEEGEETLLVKGPRRLNPTSIKTMPYPGFPTDAQSQFMAMMTISKGESRVVETVFENRFMHVAELVRMGAVIDIIGKEAIIRGVSALQGAEVRATDLRAGAALVLAGLVAQGKTVLSELYHLDRGYYRLEEKIQALGGDIQRINF
ncbi:UDP-N-acetylglucosamine 1-carboxyvinyltransferase [Peptostreptococcaceae bacterium oral taxon 113 str. W5053]|nr:UDP-N-acetylglucosamine 1-carboxyvinyltransferase [Peptostreptococcaceae bacterium oral taxon 113 str. W5053]